MKTRTQDDYFKSIMNRMLIVEIIRGHHHNEADSFFTIRNRREIVKVSYFYIGQLLRVRKYVYTKRISNQRFMIGE